jgi:hypothetical protein
VRLTCRVMLFSSLFDLGTGCIIAVMCPLDGTYPSSSSLIRLKRIYNFGCSMLVFTPFALCFVTFRGVFMRFLELTY